MNSTQPLRPLSAGEIIDTAFRLYRRHFVAFFGIAAIPLTVITFLRVFWIYQFASTTLLDWVQILLVGNFITFALTKAIANTYLGRPVTIGGSYRIGWRRFGSLLGALFLEGLVVGAPALLFVCIGPFLASSGMAAGASQVILCLMLPYILWAVYFNVRYVAVAPSIVAEDLGAAASLRRSWALTAGSFWRIFGLNLASGILVYLVSGLPATLLAYALAALPLDILSGAALIDIVSQLGAMAAMPVQLAVNTLLYYDLRVRNEGFDLELMAQQMTAPDES